MGHVLTGGKAMFTQKINNSCLSSEVGNKKIKMKKRANDGEKDFKKIRNRG